ncbi:MAG: RICIN domain-containing protein [Mucilaginibacter sp.]
MRNKPMLLLMATAGLLIVQGCKRTELKKPEAAQTFVNNKKNASAPSNHGTFYISNVNSGKVIEVKSTSQLVDGEAIQQNPYSGSGTATAPNQKWILIQQGTGSITSTTKFKIMSVVSGKYIEVPLAGTSPGTQMWQDKANTNNAQQWYIQLVATNKYKIVNVGNGLVLAANLTTNGAAITQQTFVSGDTKQQWVLNSITAEAYRDDDVVNYFHRTASGTTVAWDQGNTIPLTYSGNNGKVIWVTGDAYNGSQLNGNQKINCGTFFMYRNSALIQPASKSWDPALTTNITTTNSTVSPLEIMESPGAHGSTYRWPGPGVELSDKVYYFTYESQYVSGSTTIPENQALYRLTQNTGSNAWGTATRLTPAGMSGQTDIQYKEGMVKPGDGYVYVFGSKGIFFNTQNIYVARFATGTPTTWQFWNGTAWTSTRTNAAAAIIHVGSGDYTQQNVNISYVNGKYVLVQLDLGFFCDPASHDVYISTSATPTGPFTAPQKVFTIQDKYTDGHLAKYYTPALHPEFNNSSNELLLTYSLNYFGNNYDPDGAGPLPPTNCSTSYCAGTTDQDPNFYQLKAVRIPYSLVGL